MMIFQWFQKKLKQYQLIKKKIYFKFFKEPDVHVVFKI